MKDRKLLKVIAVVLIGLILFYSILLVFGGNIATLIYQALFYGKYNLTFISEIVLLLFSLLVLIVRKKLYVLKPRGKKFFDSIKRGMPILVVSLLVLFSNSMGLLGESLDVPNLISLIVLAITIGMAEEFFFRGFIQEEITSAYGKTRKQVIISIVISGIIFGIVHLSNALNGQDIITTVMQVLQASSLGILLGSVYFITKNIWSVVFLHSFYDFVVLLGEVNSYKDCVNNTDVSTIMLIFTIVGSLVYAVVYLVGAYLNLQERHINEYIGCEVTEDIIAKNKENATKAKKLIVIVVVVLVWTSLLVPTDDVSKSQICYNYDAIDIKGEVSFSLEDEFILNDIKLSVANKILVIESIDGENRLEIENLDDDIYDIYVYEIDNNYHILLNANDILYYGVISKDIAVFSDDFYKILTDSFQKYDVPEIMSIGKLQSEGEVYPLMKSYISDYFIIKDNAVMVID